MKWHHLPLKEHEVYALSSVEGEAVYAVFSLPFVMDCLERIVMENKISLARTISIIGTLILCIALVGNSFEVLSVTAFRIIIAFGILIQIISLICSVKKREF